MPKNYKPGEVCRKSGQYGITPGGGERTVVKDEPFPPTPKKGQRFKLVDPTKTKPKK